MFGASQKRRYNSLLIIVVFGRRVVEIEGAEAAAVGAGERNGVWRVHSLDGMPEDAVEKIVVVEVGSAEAPVVFLVRSDPVPEKHFANKMSDGTVGNDRDPSTGSG
jgi:hypothetical protein